MRAVQPDVLLLARPQLDDELAAYLHEIGGEAWLEQLDRDQLTAQDLAEFAGRLCYRSFQPGPNPNVTRIRTDQTEYLRNVFRHTPQGAGFRVALHQGNGMAGVIVADAGPGIADPEDALRRGRSGAGSTGLGLDIVRRLAEPTGGKVRIEPSALGGASVHLWLRTDGTPVAPRSRRLLRRSRGH